MSNKQVQGCSSGPGSRTRRKTSGEPSISANKCKEIIQDMLIANGHREMLKRLLQSRLAQSGWTYALRTKYIDYIKERGADNVNVSHMIEDMVPQGVESFPEGVKVEIEDLIYNFATEYITVDESLPNSPEDDEDLDPESFSYQSRDVEPEPGIGFNVPTPEINLSRSPSPISFPRALTPQSSIPILHPENITDETKEVVEEPLCEDEEDNISNIENEGGEDNGDEEDEMGDGEEQDEDDDLNNQNEESEEELMDV